MVGLYFYGIFRQRESLFKITSFKNFANTSFALLPSSRFNPHIYFILLCPNTITEMPSLIRKEKITCENCGTQTTRNNIVRHKKSCLLRTLYFNQCPNFSKLSQDDLNYHVAKKHCVPRPSITYKCKLCYADFSGFYALRQNKNTQHGTQIDFGASNIDVDDIVGDFDDQSLREDMESCKHFLTDTEMENGRQRVFNLNMSSFSISLLNDKLDYVFKELKCAAKVILAFGFVLKNVEDGSSRYFYAHENNQLWRIRNLCVHKLI